jgi:hypothetical protein
VKKKSCNLSGSPLADCSATTPAPEQHLSDGSLSSNARLIRVKQVLDAHK